MLSWSMPSIIFMERVWYIGMLITENILLDSSIRIKVADFGRAYSGTDLEK